MAGVPVVRGERLTLREWRDADREPFALLNADARVMEYFPAPLSRAESDSLVERIVAEWSRGFGLWALEETASERFIGFVGFAVPRFTAHFTPTVEVGWRLGYEWWGRGYATEGASAALLWAPRHVTPPRGEIVSFTSTGNLRSRRVMEKLGFTHRDEDDFDHPGVEDERIRRHALHRVAFP